MTTDEENTRLVYDSKQQDYLRGLTVGVCFHTGKYRYADATAATKALVFIRQEAVNFPDKTRIEKRIYRCSFCGGWHLTHL